MVHRFARPESRKQRDWFRHTQTSMRFGSRLSIAASSVAMILILAIVPVPAHAQKTIMINFDSNAAFEESDHVKGTATPSILNAAQRKAVIAKVQKEYDDAIGAGNVKVSEGAGGDVNVIVNGGQAPGTNKGNEYGDAGQQGKPGVVHEGEFVNNKFAGDQLVNGVAESIAHEAGHKLGIANHNDDKPATKMTNLPIDDPASNDIRKADSRSFNLHDAAILAPGIALSSAEFRPGIQDTDLGVFVGKPINPVSDDNYLESFVKFTGPIGAELAIYQFNRIRQSGGSERPDRRSLTMRRSPLVNQDVLLLSSFLG
jgi:hypothetical protein